MRTWKRAFSLVWGILALCSAELSGCGAQPYEVEYPPEVVAHVEAGFQARLEAVRQGGIPKTISDLAMWYPEPPPGENAAQLYEESRVVPLGRVRLTLLKKAAAMPHYRFPIDWPDGLPRGTYSREQMEYNRGMRDAARLVHQEAIEMARLGQKEKATAALLAGFGMLRHQATEPMLIAHLVRYACRALVMEALETVLATVELDEGQLAEIDRALQSAYSPDALPRAYFAEKVLSGAPDPFVHVPTIYITEAWDLAQFRVARAVVAVERFRLGEGQLPDSLDQLVPKYLDAVPQDTFRDGPIRYARRPKGYAVHSVGRDSQARTDMATVRRDGIDLGEEVAIIIDRAEI